ncbi:MAG: hypothetical protein LQ350_005244 [Teloschistes chrysophthalmus]|nr:MAG: hypothetical protein LQ350_005244 [Niorma chrysophthalma]
MADSEDNGFTGEPATTSLAKNNAPRIPSTSVRTKIESTNKGRDFSITELIEMISTWTGPSSTSGVGSRNPFQTRTQHKASIQDLPLELGLLMFENLEDQPETLKTARLICKSFSMLASPVLFKSVFFDDNDSGRAGFYDFCQRPLLSKYTESLKLLCGFSDNHSRFPRPSLHGPKISTLKLRDHRCLLYMPIPFPTGSQCLTILHIDTRELRGSSDAQALDSLKAPWKSLCNKDDFCGLRSLTITNAGSKEPEDGGHDVLSIFRDCQFGRLQYLELNFLITYPEYLVNLLKACDWSVLQFVSIYRPQWTEEELENYSLWETLFGLEADGRVKIDYTKQLGGGEYYSESDIKFMVDNDIVPPDVATYCRIKRGFYEVLDEYVDREARKKNKLGLIHNPPRSQVSQVPSDKPPVISHRQLSLTPADSPTQPPSDNQIQPPAHNPTQSPADNPIQTPADSRTQPPEKQSIPRWKLFAPTYTPARPHKFSAPLLSSCIVPNYDAPSLHFGSSETQAYKAKKSTSGLESPSR